MSFGVATRFETSEQGGKPAIFWQQQGAAASKKHKKFSYKQKAQPFPLRSKVQIEEDPPPPAHKFTQNKKHTLPTNEKAASKRSQSANKNKASELPRQKSTENAPEKEKPAPEKTVLLI
ncbi:uncharacterized protein LOC106172552 [Lingula anatina]|uniref:Uncharacterized protein LOC106172552 n=1 Tax=Lingula anatina TaxID=7574 RepID=A0A1S3JEC6_LINAN|nr:uncharacterized protein LOC106172552 [Lingula anatina]|eukprot:XP_013408770.1 uncharacterized protein LOC106172552 [Lingula anatina]